MPGAHREGGMRLARRCEARLHADVELLCPHAEPDAASRLERRWLADLLEAQHAAVEASRLALAAGRRGELYVVDPEKAHPREATT